MRAAVLALLSTALPSAAATQAAPELASIVAKAKSIAVVRATARHQIRRVPHRPFDLLVCTVDRRLFGASHESLCFAVAPGAELATPLTADKRFLVFTAADRSYRLTPGLEQHIARWTRATPLQREVGPAWPLVTAGQELTVPAGVVPPQLLPVTAGRVPLRLMTDWIQSQLDALAGSVRAVYDTTDSGYWMVDVRSDGRWKCDRTEGALADADHSALRRAIERAADLPVEVGQGHGPDAPFLRLLLRTAREERHIQVHPRHDTETAEVDAQRAIALKLWRALPGEGRPELPRAPHRDRRERP